MYHSFREEIVFFGIKKILGLSGNPKNLSAAAVTLCILCSLFRNLQMPILRLSVLSDAGYSTSTPGFLFRATRHNHQGTTITETGNTNVSSFWRRDWIKSATTKPFHGYLPPIHSHSSRLYHGVFV